MGGWEGSGTEQSTKSQRTRMPQLTAEEREIAAGADGAARAMAMRIVADTADILGAERLVPIASAHIDACLYLGPAGVAFAERLVELGGRVAVPTSLNVGVLDTAAPDRLAADPRRHEMGTRLAKAYLDLGCQPSWTCAPYQAGHRPGPGSHVAWGESNAVAFCNSVLGARTNRIGDLLDIAAALTGRAPYHGLHLDAARRATILVDAGGLHPDLTRDPAFFPVLGAWLGAEIGGQVAVIDGLDQVGVDEDRLKALGAAAASTGSVALFHITGVTPEAPDLATALGGREPARRITLTPDMLGAARDHLSAVVEGPVAAAAVGSPHFSLAEFDTMLDLFAGRRSTVPFYACTGPAEHAALTADGRLARLSQAGVEVVAGTCVVVAPIMAATDRGVLMTNSAKFAHYCRPNAGYLPAFGTLSEVVESAVAGTIRISSEVWS